VAWATACTARYLCAGIQNDPWFASCPPSLRAAPCHPSASLMRREAVSAGLSHAQRLTAVCLRRGAGDACMDDAGATARRGQWASQHAPRGRHPCLGEQQSAVRAPRVRRRDRPPCHTGRGQSWGMSGGQRGTGPRRGLRGGRAPSHRTAAAHRHPRPAPSSGKRRQSKGTARPCIIRIVPAGYSWYTCSRHKDASLW